MNNGLRSIRPLARESLKGVEPAIIGRKLPKFENVDPKTLYVEDAYQRAIMSNGTALIRKIYANFDWSHYKTPVCVRLAESGNVLVCIDGQHTATACASHPGIEKIPVMVVDAADVPKRAAAFVGHNKDRIGLTTVMIYHAELAAKDQDAVIIDRALRKAGASIPRRAISTAGGEKHPVGVTMSIGAIRAIAKRQGEEALVRVLRLLVAVGRGPIKSVEITAAALIFAIYQPPIDDKLRKVIMRKTTEEWTALGYAESVESGKANAVAVAAMWCRELGVEAPDPGVKGNNTDMQRLIIAPAAQKKAAQPSVVVPSMPRPLPPPAKPAVASPPPAPSRPTVDNVVRRNGIVVDLDMAMVSHRGGVAPLTPDGAVLVATLAKVMPAMLPYENLATKVFGRGGDARQMVSQLVDRLNPLLVKARLEIKTVPKMGNVLADLGPAAT